MTKRIEKIGICLRQKGLGGRLAAIGAFFWMAFGTSGCVSINDGSVQVQRPGEVDYYKRNVLDKCTPHVLPHRLIKAEVVVGSAVLPGGVDVQEQKWFDHYWNNVTPVIESGGATADSLKPVINWDVQTVRFLPIALSNSCEKIQPMGMETDCYNIYFNLYRYVEGKNCSARSTYPVLIYIYPKTTLPLEVKWIKSPEPTPSPAP